MLEGSLNVPKQAGIGFWKHYIKAYKQIGNGRSAADPCL